MIKRTLLLLLLFSPVLAGAADYAPDVQFEELNDFSGGLYTNAEPHKIPKNFSPSLRNVLGDEKDGSLVEFNGFQALGSTGMLNGVKLIIPFDKGNGNVEFIVSDASRVLSTTDFNTYVTIKTGLNATVNIHGKQINRKVWLTNGSDPVFTYDGTTVTVLDGQTYSGVQTPNVPRGQYIEYDMGRVWLGNTSANDSYTYYSEPKSTDSVLLAPDDHRAWPATNILLVGVGDGTPITFVKSFRGRLFIGKTLGIYSVFGNNRFSFIPVKTNAKVGFISADSVTELDDRLYGQALDGFYAFNGDSTERLTDRISPNISEIRTDTSRIVQDTWDTQTEFEDGGMFHGTTATADGFLTMRRDFYVANEISTDTARSTTDYVRLSTNNVATAFTLIIPTSTKEGFVGIPSSFTFYSRGGNWSGGAGGSQSFDQDSDGTTVTIRNSATGKEKGFYCRTINEMPNDLFSQVICRDANPANPPSWTPPFTGPTFDQVDLLAGRLTIQIAGIIGNMQIGAFYDIIPSTKSFNSNITLAAATTGQYLTAVTTVTPLTAWSYFNSVNTPNGGSISFFYKTATAAATIATAPFTAITPGAIVNSSSTQNYIQIAATIAAVDNSSIDRITVEHIEGAGTETRSIATDWMNRWWIFVATESTGDFPALYIKSRNSNKVPNAWWPGAGINIKAITKFNNVLYGGSANGGTFYRLDYGSSFDGAPIGPYYDTPVMVFGNTYYEKTLLDLWMDMEFESGNTLTLGTAVNGGDFSYQSVSLNGSGRSTKKIFNLDLYAKSFQFRFKNSQIDKGLQIHSIIFPHLAYRLQ